MDAQMNFKIKIVSFGYKYGMPEYANFLHDVRFLPNPYYDENLKHKTGLFKEVRDYVKNSEVSIEYIKTLKKFFDITIPACIESGRKEDLVIAIGCTGGRHRSVTVAYELFEHLKLKGYNPEICHRDIEKDE